MINNRHRKVKSGWWLTKRLCGVNPLKGVEPNIPSVRATVVVILFSHLYVIIYLFPDMYAMYIDAITTIMLAIVVGVIFIGSLIGSGV